MRMKKRDAKDLIKLRETLNNPNLDDYQEVFSFVKSITDKGLNPHDLTAEDKGVLS